MFNVPEKHRLMKGDFATDSSYGNNGVFIIPHPKVVGYFFSVIASDGAVKDGDPAWEHVSVEVVSKTRKVDRCPTWQEMCHIKDIFWGKQDCVVQYHPPAENYVNDHPNVLHLWRPVGMGIPMPPTIMV